MMGQSKSQQFAGVAKLRGLCQTPDDGAAVHRDLSRLVNGPA